MTAHVFAGSCAAQQQGDTGFRYENPAPRYSSGEGPVVCIDEAHYNFHTADGRYAPFASLLRTDGFRVAGSSDLFRAETLAACDVMVVANALAASNDGDWTYPHPSAFAREEILAVLAWIQEGGRFLMFADHAPFPGAARDLGAVLGLFMADVYADGGPGSGPDVFRMSDGTLHDHPMLAGAIDSVTTFTGQAIRTTDGWEPLLTFGPDAIARFHPRQIFQDEAQGSWPSFPIPGWTHGATRELGEGRVVFLGEAAMCSAQVYGEGQRMGMNHPGAPQNALFCLSAVRWLADGIN